MAVRELKADIHFVGAVDWDRRLFDELIPLPEGTSYNAYLVKGEDKTALIDTVDPDKEQEFNDFFNNVHIREIVQLRGAKRATRYRAASRPVGGPPVPYPKYFTVYEFDSEESLAEYEASREKQNRGEIPPLTSVPVQVEQVWRTAYVPISQVSE